MTDKLLTIKDAAENLSCSTRHVRRIIASGELPVVAIGEGTRGDRIRAEDLDGYRKRKLRNRGATNPCPSNNVVAFGTSMSRSAASALDKLLGAGRPGPHALERTVIRYALPDLHQSRSPAGRHQVPVA